MSCGWAAAGCTCSRPRSSSCFWLSFWPRISPTVGITVKPTLGVQGALWVAVSGTGKGTFTIEIAPPDIKTYYLQPSIRYAHAREYIRTLANQNQFNIVTERKITLRRQRNENLPGLLYILSLTPVIANEFINVQLLNVYGKRSRKK